MMGNEKGDRKSKSPAKPRMPLTVSGEEEAVGDVEVGGFPGLSPGEVVGDFEIIEEVGRGGMGVVYRAHERSLRRVVALKIINPSIAQNRSAAKRFRREAILAANLSHPNIVPVFSVDENDPSEYFTMEFVQGKSVKEKVEEKGYLNPAEAIRIAMQACEALKYAHDRNIIHRDIKPHNLLLQNHVERVRITDFGIAQDITGNLAEVTQTEGMTFGTPAFMSPEQNLGQQLDIRTDVFSLGMTLYYILTGEVAYKVRNRQELAVAFGEQTPQPPSRLNPEVSKSLDGIVMKMIAVDPRERYAGMADVLGDLRLVQDGPKPSLPQNGRSNGKSTASVNEHQVRASTDHSYADTDRAKGKSRTFFRNLGILVVLFLVLWAAQLVWKELVATKTLTLDLGGGESMKLVLIPAGKFLMGSPKGDIYSFGDQRPRREVTISKSFYMGATEVTQAQWLAVMRTEPWKGSSYARSGANNAVSCVNRDDASKFCEVLSEKTGKKVMLPTEAQWEYACRAGRKTAFCYGDDPSKLGDYAWFAGNITDAWSDAESSGHYSVGQKKPNAFGLYDMHGNARELCRDWYDENFYAKAKYVDPENTTKSESHVLRGGSRAGPWRSCRSAHRDHVSTKESLLFTFTSIGFRVVVMCD